MVNYLRLNVTKDERTAFHLLDEFDKIKAVMPYRKPKNFGGLTELNVVFRDLSESKIIEILDKNNISGYELNKVNQMMVEFTDTYDSHHEENADSNIELYKKICRKFSVDNVYRKEKHGELQVKGTLIGDIMKLSALINEWPRVIKIDKEHIY